VLPDPLQALPDLLSHPSAQPPASGVGELPFWLPPGACAEGIDPAQWRLLPEAPGEKARPQSATVSAGASVGLRRRRNRDAA
jgi:hypothetical protein